MYLIDTDIMIYSLKGHQTVEDHFRKFASLPKGISVITYGELRFGAEKSQKKTANLARVARIAELFPPIPINSGIMDIYAEIKMLTGKKGWVTDDFDLLIGATALYMNFILVTNNEAHFKKIPDLKLANWSKS